MQVYGQVDAFLPGHFDQPVGEPLGDAAVRHAGVGAVQVAALHACHGLARGRVDVDIGIRPLVDGIRGPRAVAEVAPLTGRGLETECLGMGVLREGVGATHHVGVGDYDQPAAFDDGPFQQHHGGNDAGGLVGVGAAEDQDGAARLGAFLDPDVGVGSRFGDTIEIRAQPPVDEALRGHEPVHLLPGRAHHQVAAAADRGDRQRGDQQQRRCQFRALEFLLEQGLLPT